MNILQGLRWLVIVGTTGMLLIHAPDLFVPMVMVFTWYPSGGARQRQEQEGG